MRRFVRVAAAAMAVATVLLPRSALAQAPVAIVEDISSKSAGIELMDYVAAGKTIQLQAGDTLVLSYLVSCWRETITGGVVTIGLGQSTVFNGKVTRTLPRCDGGKMELTRAEANKSGALSFRAPPKGSKGSLADAATAMVYSRTPIFDVRRPGRLLIERLDQAGGELAIDITDKHLLHGAFFDLARTSKSLEPGGVYRASYGDREIVFKVDRSAETGLSPLVGRLVRFHSRS